MRVKTVAVLAAANLLMQMSSECCLESLLHFHAAEVHRTVSASQLMQLGVGTLTVLCYFKTPHSCVPLVDGAFPQFCAKCHGRTNTTCRCLQLFFFLTGGFHPLGSITASSELKFFICLRACADKLVTIVLFLHIRHFKMFFRTTLHGRMPEFHGS